MSVFYLFLPGYCEYSSFSGIRLWLDDYFVLVIIFFAAVRGKE